MKKSFWLKRNTFSWVLSGDILVVVIIRLLLVFVVSIDSGACVDTLEDPLDIPQRTSQENPSFVYSHLHFFFF